MRLLYIGSLLLSASVLMTSCQNGETSGTSKTDSTATTTEPAPALATLTVKPQHHGMAAHLSGMMVKIKYNAKDMPANGIYDDSAKCEMTNGEAWCKFNNLKAGDYFMVGLGVDDSLKKEVHGSGTYAISGGGDQTFNLPVSEE